jgi:GT2 family glycosyltransferase
MASMDDLPVIPDHPPIAADAAEPIASAAGRKAAEAGLRIGAVVIGRNEGARLLACLASLEAVDPALTVYVDSGSTDGSVAAAAAAGARVVELDPSIPFSAARARNAGLAALRALPHPPDLVQFVDGDCVLREGWIAAAAAFLAANPRAAIACGRLRERHPETSIYKRLCDWEWDTPVGPIPVCGGIAMIRVAPLIEVGGFRDDIVAGEDEEVCIRLRAAGHEIWRLGAEMAWHDAAIHRLGQWHRRMVRAGYAYADLGTRHPAHFAAERRRAWLWGALLPLAGAGGALAAPWLTLGVAGLYALSIGRMSLRFARRGMGAGTALGAAALVALSKFSNVQGMLTHRARRARAKPAVIIEYK